jgi:hypothetical protein
MDDLKAIIGKVATGAALSRDEAAAAFDRMMSGEATPSQMGALLMGLRVRGETVDEITGAVSAMRSKMLTVKAPPTPSISSAPAAMARARSMYRPAPRSFSPAPAFRLPSTAIAHCRRNRERRTRSPRSASTSTSRRTT